MGQRVNHCTAAIFAPARRGRDMRFFARPAHLRSFRAATGVTPVPLYVANCLADEQILPTSEENGEILSSLGE